MIRRSTPFALSATRERPLAATCPAASSRCWPSPASLVQSPKPAADRRTGRRWGSASVACHFAHGQSVQRVVMNTAPSVIMVEERFPAGARGGGRGHRLRCMRQHRARRSAYRSNKTNTSVVESRLHVADRSRRRGCRGRWSRHRPWRGHREPGEAGSHDVLRTAASGCTPSPRPPCRPCRLDDPMPALAEHTDLSSGMGVPLQVKVRPPESGMVTFVAAAVAALTPAAVRAASTPS